MSWDPFQRDVLAELGLVLYRQAGTALASDSEGLHIEAPAGDAAMIDAAILADPMLVRVARAARMSTEALQACIGDIRVITSLHGNASAKRALWSRLRALRRSRP